MITGDIILDNANRQVKEYDTKNLSLFRQTFEINELPTLAKIMLTADSRYKLFINGKFVGRGPYAAENYFYYYDTFDVKDFGV